MGGGGGRVDSLKGAKWGDGGGGGGCGGSGAAGGGERISFRRGEGAKQREAFAGSVEVRGGGA